MEKPLIEVQYLAPVGYYKILASSTEVVLEREENFVKSTYRNRCYIAGPNGKLRLTIPLEHGKDQRKKYKDVKILEDGFWQKIHWQSLTSCYRNSPYFEYYEDEFFPFYHKPQRFLYDFNLELTHFLLKLLKIDPVISFTSGYEKNPAEVTDLRSAINPNPDKNLEVSYLPYSQVFMNKTGFIPDLSIVDLLFNEGPQWREVLEVQQAR